jgi:hypothetical protein
MEKLRPVYGAKMLGEQLANEPRSEALTEAEAADIPEHSLIAAADALGVRCRRGQWWLRGQSNARCDPRRYPGMGSSQWLFEFMT